MSKKLSLDFKALEKKPTVPKDERPERVGEERPKRKKPGPKPKPDKEDTYTVEVKKRLQHKLKAAAALSGMKVYEYVDKVLEAAIEKTLGKHEPNH